MGARREGGNQPRRRWIRFGPNNSVGNDADSHKRARASSLPLHVRLLCITTSLPRHSTRARELGAEKGHGGVGVPLALLRLGQKSRKHQACRSSDAAFIKYAHPPEHSSCNNQLLLLLPYGLLPPSQTFPTSDGTANGTNTSPWYKLKKKRTYGELQSSLDWQ